MSNVLHTADWHIDHENILKFRQLDVTTVEEHNTLIFDNYNDMIGKNDLVYFHGDILFSKNHLDTLKKLPGRKILILGNHCRDKSIRPTILDLIQVFDDIQGITKHKRTWLTHAPVHEDELRGCMNIHGHTHNHFIDNPMYLNVCLEHWNMKPVAREELLKEWECVKGVWRKK